MEITADIAASRLPERPEQGHKGTFGHLFIIAGSRGFTGAAKLTSMAAGRSGVGLVTVGVPEPLGDVVGAGLLEAMSLLLPASPAESVDYAALDTALDFASNKQAVVLGPGLSQHPDTRRFVLEFVRRCPVPLLVDADGLNCLATRPDVLAEAAGSVVVTPHPGEMARLTGQSAAQVQEDRAGTARAFAEEHGCVVALKGYRTVVASPDGHEAVNTTGNSGMGTGGTGDILSGLMGGLMAQGMPGFDAALAAVFIHGRAGDIAAERMTARAMVAGDVIGALPDAWRELQGEMKP